MIYISNNIDESCEAKIEFDDIESDLEHYEDSLTKEDIVND